MPEEPANNQPQQESTPTPPTTAPPAPVSPVPSASGRSNGLATAAMIIGIISLIFAWAPFFGMATGIAAIVMGSIALKKSTNKGMSIAGIVTGALATLAGLIVTIMLVAGLALFSGVAITAGNEINKAVATYNKE